MERREALKILNLDSSASETDIKKSFRKLATQYHPDKTQDPKEKETLQEKFKEINTAYQTLTNPQPEQFESPFGGVNMSEIFNHFNFGNLNEEIKIPDPIKINLPLSFKESVLGTKKEILFDRKDPCLTCRGKKVISSKDKCTKCNGTGMCSVQRGNIAMNFSCNNCKGSGRILNLCTACVGQGFTSKQHKVTAVVPPGWLPHNILKMNEIGDFVPNLGRLPVMVKFDIEPFPDDPSLKLDENNVISSLKISLLESLEGASKEVFTIHGKKEITIPPKTLNRDLISIPQCGAPPYGEQVIVIHVEYPDNVKDIIQFLKENKGKC